MPPRISPDNATSLRDLVTGPVTTRRWLLRALVRLTGGGLGVLLVIAAVVAYLLTLRPDIARARQLARSELQVLLEPAGHERRRRRWHRAGTGCRCIAHVAVSKSAGSIMRGGAGSARRG